MALVLVRVDDRLVHGQVMEAWAPFLRADAVLVADDAVLADPLRRRLFECLAGKGVEVGVVSCAGLPAALAGRLAQKVIVLFSSLAAAAEAVEAGLPVSRINVGNLHHSGRCPGGGEWQVAPSIFLDDGDLALLDRLRVRGVEVEGRDVPEGKGVELSRLAVDSARRRAGGKGGPEGAGGLRG